MFDTYGYVVLLQQTSIVVLTFIINSKSIHTDSSVLLGINGRGFSSNAIVKILYFVLYGQHIIKQMYFYYNIHVMYDRLYLFNVFSDHGQ